MKSGHMCSFRDGTEQVKKCESEISVSLVESFISNPRHDKNKIDISMKET